MIEAAVIEAGGMVANDEALARDELLELPGVERVLWFGPGVDPGELGSRPTLVGDNTRTWLEIVATMAARMSEELGYSQPRLITLNYDDRLVALAADDSGAIVAVVTRDPSCVGLAMVKLRRWLAIRLGSVQ